MIWTEEKVKLMCDLNLEGLSASEIAKEMMAVTGEAATRNMVIGKLYRNRHPRDRKVALNRLPEPEPTHVKAKVTFMDLGHRMCKWPVGTVGKPDFGFCGEETELGKSYCACHMRKSRGLPHERGKKPDKYEKFGRISRT
jgi:GcrA cell cycle regulator